MTKNNFTILVELLCEAEEHIEINGGWVDYFSKFSKIKVLAESKHLSSLPSFTNKKFIYDTLQKYDRKKTYWQRLKAIFKAYKTLNSESKNSKVVFLSADIPVLLTALMLKDFNELSIVFHGDIRNIDPENKGTRGYIIMKALIQLISNKVKSFYVPTKLGKLALEQIGVESDKITVKIYPRKLIFSRDVISTKLKKLVTIGQYIPEKNSHLFYRLAEKFKISNPDVRFIYLGRLYSDKKHMKDIDNIDMHPQTDYLCKKEFHSWLSQADAIIVFFPQNYLRLGMTGILWESIQYRLPIFALKNEMLLYFKNKYGLPIFLFEDLSKMQAGLIDFAKNHKKYIGEIEENSYNVFFKNL